MSLDECRALKALKENNNTTINGWQEDCDDFSFGDVCNGTEPLAISHAGGEFTDLTREVLGDFWKINNCIQHVDNRTCRDCVLHRNKVFAEQLPVITSAYLVWSLAKCKEGFFERLEKEGLGLESGSDYGQWPISVIDVFYAEKVILRILPTDATISSVLVRQGMMPCSPISPTVIITTKALDLYHVAHLRSPQLSIQAFVKTMCNLHGVGFHRHLSRQFSIVFDLYLQVRCSMAAMVLCSQEVEGLGLGFSSCAAPLAKMGRPLGSTLRVGNTSSELPAGQQLASDRYLSRTFVDQFTWDSTTAGDEDVHLENLCEGCWKNMDNAKTRQAWGVYDETGIFVAVCRHGFSLLVADMVQSGELSKYPLAIVSKLLDVFGSNLGGGYDIGCQFKTTLDNSSLRPLARSMHHMCLVSAFHGHAHRQLCQLFSLTTYIKGLGLKDLETCEWTFSKSNLLASALWYASIFHRRQAINTYFEHNINFEVYVNLSDFLYNNYKQALDITIFEHWLEEEKMEYWQRLVSLTASEETLDAAITAFQGSSHLKAVPYDVQAKNTRNAESARWHALEDHERNLKLVQALKCKLEIEKCWTPHDAEWQKVGRLVANWKYQHALDRLKGLIIARIFELTRMNRAGTGYKLWKHIAKTLQTRSVAIRTALNTYNAITGSMHPPHRTPKWDEVVEYAFLADFDLLRDTCADVSQHPWSLAAACSTMDLHFKMCQVREEIECLNIEV
ncbi:uncharacterized protein EDB91DRAFT_1247062 [Suillus paluster]|uniref:uncharacterized protein n=1 Tax=Suillus paluster TaxID=48578 RepID=UPI001B86677C|nr:uncharacterized protein EDB91DRAFT_1247062 [Suillus paluster]KAG1743564.1 hypothetical protein EDB91DRAFT_1247062 [Suillus paluster]